MSQQNGTRHQTAFTVSIEAREGVTTGISAADRAKTIAVAIQSDSTRDDITTPGHVFPLVAREGGTLVRAGHTEASVDIARKAGLNPSAVICEIMNDDGTMARLPDLVTFAQKHNLKLGTIADLIAHRRLTERLVRKVEEGVFKHAAGGDWRAIVYANTVEYQEHLALVKGDISDGAPVMVRMHAVDLLDDMTGQPHWIAVHNAMHMIGEAGRGVVVMIREHRKTALAERVRLLSAQPRPQRELRDYGIGAQILLDLGVKNMILLTNRRRTVIGLEGYGLNIVEQRTDPEYRRRGVRGMIECLVAMRPAAHRHGPLHLVTVRSALATVRAIAPRDLRHGPVDRAIGIDTMSRAMAGQAGHDDFATDHDDGGARQVALSP